jgi:hypothetical protein
MGEAAVRRSRSCSRLPYSRSRAARRYSEVFLEEGDERGHADDVDAGCPEVGLHGGAGQDHVAAVGAAPECAACGVEAEVGQPGPEGGEVGDGVEPLVDVVEADPALAVPGGAADVGDEHGEACGGERLDHR